jgi:hypothetical protein
VFVVILAYQQLVLRLHDFNLREKFTFQIIVEYEANLNNFMIFVNEQRHSKSKSYRL